jgi:hypothetical protein
MRSDFERLFAPAGNKAASYGHAVKQFQYAGIFHHNSDDVTPRNFLPLVVLEVVSSSATDGNPFFSGFQTIFRNLSITNISSTVERLSFAGN